MLGYQEVIIKTAKSAIYNPASFVHGVHRLTN